MNYLPQYQKSFALLIGINRYPVRPLEVARADAESMVEVLTGQLGFPKEHVTALLDENATKANILRNFSAFERLCPDDRLLVFFAGHGTTVPGRRGPVGYLVPVDGKMADKSTLIRWDELTRNAEIIPAKHILFIMDACYSGLAIQRTASIGEQRFVSDMLQRLSRQVVTAGKGDEPVADGGGPTGSNSIFTGHLLEGLRGKAVNEHGVLTASLLMNYVYEKVGCDPRSDQTPHFGHLEGEGDFIFSTPNGEHLPGGPKGDYLVRPVVERPEAPIDIPPASVRPVFAEKNGYGDPEQVLFGQNEWSKKLGFQDRSELSPGLKRPSHWLSLVVEPISNQPVNLDLLSLAKTLPIQSSPVGNPNEEFVMPSQALTTAKALILYEPEHIREGGSSEYWKRFMRVDRAGNIEYCLYKGAARTFQPNLGAKNYKLFNYVQIIGTIWTFLHAAKRILGFGDYQAGVRLLVNLVGTHESLLANFARTPNGVQSWREPFDPEALIGGSAANWKCRDSNLQIPFKLVLGSLGEVEAKKLIVECADQLGLAYNHQSKPRCFIHGTDKFPWEQFNPRMD